MSSDRISLILVSVMYPVLSVSLLSMGICFLIRFRLFSATETWLKYFGFACVLIGVGFGISAVVITVRPLVSRSAGIPLSRTILSMAAIPAAMAALSMAHSLRKSVTLYLKALARKREVEALNEANFKRSLIGSERQTQGVRSVRTAP